MSVGFKPFCQNLLKQLGLYHRLKASSIYRLYWRVAGAAVIEEARRELEFYRRLLTGFRNGDLVFDIGANQGTKTDVFLRMGARVVAVDPDSTNKEILGDKFVRFRVTPKPVAIVNKAVSDRVTTATMWVDEAGSAKNTLSRKWVDTLTADESRFGHMLTFGSEVNVATTTLEELITAHGMPFFVKIDVEGYELSVLRGLRRPVRYLSFEVNLPEFRPEGLRCVDVLRDLAVDGKFNYAVDCGEGMVLGEWLVAEEFSYELSRCEHPSIEVFWKTCS